MSEQIQNDRENSTMRAGTEEAEPWEGWETKLVWYSIGIGIAVLIIGGIL